MSTTVDLGRVRERASAVYRCTLIDQDEDPIPVSSLDALYLTVYDVATEAILNDRDRQDVLNANNVTVNSDGELEWEIQSEDNALVTAAKSLEQHMFVFEFEWDSGARRDWIRRLVTIEAEFAVT
jgi:hypothetical protein